MRPRWFSTFTIIGVLLLGLGLFALIMQHFGKTFVFDPGQPPPAQGPDLTAWYYLAIGALMVLNGIIIPVMLPGEVPAASQRVGEGNYASPQSVSSPAHTAAAQDKTDRSV